LLHNALCGNKGGRVDDDISDNVVDDILDEIIDDIIALNK